MSLTIEELEKWIFELSKRKPPRTMDEWPLHDYPMLSDDEFRMLVSSQNITFIGGSEGYRRMTERMEKLGIEYKQKEDRFPVVTPRSRVDQFFDQYHDNNNTPPDFENFTTIKDGKYIFYIQECPEFRNPNFGLIPPYKKHWLNEGNTSTDTSKEKE